MNWCPECLPRSRDGHVPEPGKALTLPREDCIRQSLAHMHAVDLLRAGFRPALYVQGVPARHVVTHFTGVALDGITKARGVACEPDEEAVDAADTQPQSWVPRWVWVVRDVGRRGSGDDFGLPGKALDAWLLELEDLPELRDALCSAYDLGGREGASALLAPGGPPRRRGARWAALR